MLLVTAIGVGERQRLLCCDDLCAAKHERARDEENAGDEQRASEPMRELTRRLRDGVEDEQKRQKRECWTERVVVVEIFNLQAGEYPPAGEHLAA